MGFLLIMSITELYLSFYKRRSKKLVKILFYTFQILAQSGSYIKIYVFNIKSAEITCFFNCICKSCSILDLAHYNLDSSAKTKSSESKLFLVLAVFTAISIFVFFQVALPIVCVSIPSFHDALFVDFIFSSINSIMFRIFVFLIQMPCVIPVSSICSLGTTCFSVALSEINMALKPYGNLFKKKFSNLLV